MYKISMHEQPIYDLHENRIIMKELLCRPPKVKVEDFFNVKNQVELWKREFLCLKHGLNMNSNLPINMNITMSSLPYFLSTKMSWRGGIEIVEWGLKEEDTLRMLPIYVKYLQKRDLSVWVDDLKPEMWNLWENIDVTGYKVEYKDIQHDFIYDLASKEKPIIVEQIETLEHLKTIESKGFRYAQGFFVDGMELIESGKTVRSF